MAQQVFVAVEGQRHPIRLCSLLGGFRVRRAHGDELVVRQMGQGWEVGPCAPAVVDICSNNAKANLLVCHSNVLQCNRRRDKRNRRRAACDSHHRARELRHSYTVHSSTGALTVQTSETTSFPSPHGRGCSPASTLK